MANIVVLGSNSIFRAGLVSLLGAMGFDQVEEADDVDKLRAFEAEGMPELLLVSLPEDRETVASLVSDLIALAPSSKIVFLADAFDMELLCNCFSAGASAYLLASISSEALCESLRLVCAGEKVFPSDLASLIPELSEICNSHHSLASAEPPTDLSLRETEILQALTNGESNKVIARNLDIAEATVKVHVKRILRKAHVSNRTQAALWAVSMGITQLPHQTPSS